jgi:hypothetical protein
MPRTVRNLVFLFAALVAREGVSVAQVVRPPQLGYSNDTRVPLVVQVSALIGNQERRGQPRSVNPREQHNESINVPNVKVLYLTIYDQQLRPLARYPIHFLGRDVFYSIQIDPIGAQFDKKPVVRIVEIRLPQPGPGGFPGAMQGFPGMHPGFQPGMPGKLPGVPAVPPIPVPPSTAAPIPPKKN